MTPYELLDLGTRPATHSQAGRLLAVVASLAKQGMTLRIDLTSTSAEQAETRLLHELRFAPRRSGPNWLRYGVAHVPDGGWAAGADLTQLVRNLPATGEVVAVQELRFKWSPSLAVAEALRVTLIAHGVPATWNGRADGPVVADLRASRILAGKA